MILWSIILIVNNLLWAFKDSTPLPIIHKDAIEKKYQTELSLLKLYVN